MESWLKRNEQSVIKEKKMHSTILRDLGQQTYEEVWQAMREFTDNRTSETSDEIWLVEHSPVYTLGQAGKVEHILNPTGIPVVNSDRGGQVTYHGPGQLVVYVLIDLPRKKWGVRRLVTFLEQSIIDYLSGYKIEAFARTDAPGVYVNGAKICSVGLRVRRGCSYHGLAFNVAMDLKPFQSINPCGYANMPITQMSDLDRTISFEQVKTELSFSMQQYLDSIDK